MFSTVITIAVCTTTQSVIVNTQDENYRKANMGYEPTHVEVFEQIADR